MRELGQAILVLYLNDGIKINVLYMDACLMAAIEAAYEFDVGCDYYVASENEIYVDIERFDFPDNYLNSITFNTNPASLALRIAQSYSYYFEYVEPAAYRGCINKTFHFDEDANLRNIRRMEAR